MSEIEIRPGQVFRDLDPRMAGRTLEVLSVGDAKVTLRVLTNADDIQRLLDEDVPGTRHYRPRDKRGATTTISRARLSKQGRRGFGLVEGSE